MTPEEHALVAAAISHRRRIRILLALRQEPEMLLTRLQEMLAMQDDFADARGLLLHLKKMATAVRPIEERAL